MAARGARAAGRADAAHRRAHDSAADDPEAQAPHRGVPAGAAAIGLDRRPQRADRHSLGRGRCRRAFADTRRNWSRSRRTSSWPSAARPSRGVAQATRTVPIVFAQVIDPVGAGFVASLARPGGNATGFTQFEYGLSGKWLELLKQIAPRVTRAAVLRDPSACRDRPVRGDPGRGAVARGGVEPGRRARRRRDRARRRGVRARAEWRPDRDWRARWRRSSRADRHAGGAPPTAGGLPLSASSSPAAA